MLKISSAVLKLPKHKKKVRKLNKKLRKAGRVSKYSSPGEAKAQDIIKNIKKLKKRKQEAQ